MKAYTQLDPSPTVFYERKPNTSASSSVLSTKLAVSLLRSLKLELVTLLFFTAVTDVLLYWVGLNLGTLLRLHTLVYIDFWLLQRDRLICVAVFLICAIFFGGYRKIHISDKFDSAYYLWLALLWATFLLLLLVHLVKDDLRAISVREILSGAVFSTVMLGVFRFKLATISEQLPSMRRTFHILGESNLARQLVNEFRKTTATRHIAYYCSQEFFERILQKYAVGRHVIHPREAVVILPREQRNDILDIISKGEKIYDRIYLYPSVEDLFLFPLSRFSSIAGIPVIEFALKNNAKFYVYIKRFLDIFVASVGLVVAFPIALIVAIAIKLTSPGPIFYTQERLGKDGKIFRLIKFRTMIPNAEAKTGPVWAQSNDPRVTPIGKFLRKHRIDEIPQLWNVLKGDMSLIGPRPERPHFHNEFKKTWPLFDKRLLVRPGVTSLSHVLSSYDADPGDRLRYDLLYISNLSFLLDMKILFATIRVVLGAKGAQ